MSYHTRFQPSAAVFGVLLLAVAPLSAQTAGPALVPLPPPAVAAPAPALPPSSSPVPAMVLGPLPAPSAAAEPVIGPIQMRGETLDDEE